MRILGRVVRRSGSAWLTVIAIVASCGLTACGASDPVAHISGEGTCAYPNRVVKMVVLRVNSFPKNHIHFTFPAKVEVSRPVTVRSVLSAACALPDMPSGNMSCGSGSFTGSYGLNFSTGSKQLPVIRISSICEKVTGLGRARWVARTPGFWGLLGSAMGLAHPAMSTFLAPATSS